MFPTIIIITIIKFCIVSRPQSAAIIVTVSTQRHYNISCVLSLYFDSFSYVALEHNIIILCRGAGRHRYYTTSKWYSNLNNLIVQ